MRRAHVVGSAAFAGLVLLYYLLPILRAAALAYRIRQGAEVLARRPRVAAQQERWEALNGKALSLHNQGRYAEAVLAAQEALRVAEASFGPEHPNVAASLDALAVLYSAQGKNAEAEPLYKRALAIEENRRAAEVLAGRPRVAAQQESWEALNGEAVSLHNQGRHAEAVLVVQKALRVAEASFGPEHPNVAVSLNHLAGLYGLQGKYAEAEPLFKRALAIYEKALGPDHSNVATSLNNLAVLYSAQGKYTEAEPLFKRVLAVREKALGPNHPDVAPSLTNYAALLRKTGRVAEAEQMEARAKAIRAEHAEKNPQK